LPKQVAFDVALSEAVSSGVTVTVATQDGTATAGADYTPLSNTQLAFQPGGPLIQTVLVDVVSDATPETPTGEDFSLVIGDAVLTASGTDCSGQISLGTDTAAGLIEDDDLAPTAPYCDKCDDGPTNIDGLIVRYTFNDPSAIGVDVSGNNFHSQNVRNINHDPALRCGAVAMIDKTSQVAMPAAVMNTILTNQQITVAFWFRLDYVSGYINGLVYGTNAGGSRSFNWHLPASYASATNGLEVMWDCPDRLEEPNNIGCPRTPPPSGPKICGTGLCSGTWPGTCGGHYGNWHHWAATKNVSTGIMQVFRDGVLYNSNSISGTGPFTTPIDTVTNLSVFNDQYMTVGWLDDFQIYNRELLAEEIQCLATP
jgi:hypothetical protein